MFALVELAHADVLKAFESHWEACEALDRVVSADPEAASALGVIEFDDDDGHPVGEVVLIESFTRPALFRV